MPKRKILTGHEARTTLAKGVDQVADIVKKTLGVKGRNVALDTDKWRLPLLTNDGVTIARQIIPDDDFENLGAKLVKEAAHKTEDNAGDGTTTTIMLMQALVNLGLISIEAGEDPLKLRAELEKASKKVIDYVKDQAQEAKEIEPLTWAATISCRDPKLGSLIAEVVHSAKEDGMISLEDNLGGETEVESLEGLQLRVGYMAKQFINNKALNQVVITNPYFLVTNMNLTSVEEFSLIGEQAIAVSVKVLIILAQDIGNEFMLWCYANWSNPESPLKILPIRFNQAADIADGWARDVASITGAKFIDTFIGEGMAQVDVECFGRAKKLVQNAKYTTILPNQKRYVEQRIKELKADQLDTQDYQAENIRERIARLRQACFTIRVGGSTETEIKERKTRVQDALNSARAAYEYGVIKGGGLTLYKASRQTDSHIFQEACKLPAKQLAENSGVELTDWLRLVDSNKTILDAAKVVVECVQNATTQAVQLLLCESAIIDPEVNV